MALLLPLMVGALIMLWLHSELTRLIISTNVCTTSKPAFVDRCIQAGSY